jgi:phosphoribosylaminoimidazole-succinocarboxamide synthase
MPEVLFYSELKSLPLLNRGKVRDIYAVGEDQLLIVTADRLSAFDVVLPTPIPDKGKVLTALSYFWFERTHLLIPNHLNATPIEAILPDPAERRGLAGRTMVVQRLKPLPVEAIVRGYLAGSGWKEYQKTQTVCDIPLPAGLCEADKLPEPIFTPSTKAEVGKHDENISFDQAAKLLGKPLATQVKEISLRIYQEAANYALAHGIIIADTKLEFGVDKAGQLVLIDELLTPDSSRFWPADRYAPGHSPPSFDKQYVRDYLESIGWNKQPPAPALPPGITAKTAEKYREALQRLTDRDISRV